MTKVSNTLPKNIKSDAMMRPGMQYMNETLGKVKYKVYNNQFVVLRNLAKVRLAL